jgi:hypothetical protein
MRVCRRHAADARQEPCSSSSGGSAARGAVGGYASSVSDQSERLGAERASDAVEQRIDLRDTQSFSHTSSPVVMPFAAVVWVAEAGR